MLSPAIHTDTRNNERKFIGPFIGEIQIKLKDFSILDGIEDLTAREMIQELTFQSKASNGIFEVVIEDSEPPPRLSELLNELEGDYLKLAKVIIWFLAISDFKNLEICGNVMRANRKMLQNYPFRPISLDRIVYSW